jgi:hypothetical protein
MTFDPKMEYYDPKTGKVLKDPSFDFVRKKEGT